MALAGDFFRTRFLIEVDGVQTLQKMDWKLDTVNGADDIGTVMLQIANDWFDTLDQILSTECRLTCCDFHNWSRNEQVVVYPARDGLSASSSHPQFQVVRFNKYAQDEGDTSAPIKRGATNLSGVSEDLSTRGRINDLAEFEAYRLFQVAPLLMGVTAWDISPYLRVETAPGSGVYTFLKMLWVNINPTFLCLRSRKTGQCSI